MSGNGSGDAGLAVAMRGIVKVYPDGVKALDNVDFTLRAGEVHALLGENGAGKTTLMRILYGEIKPTEGEIYVWGRKVSWRGPWDAIRNGIAMVYQQFRLVESMAVEENIAIYLSSLGLGRSEARRRTLETAERLGLEIDLGKTVAELPMGARQRVEIIKALSGGAKVLILDEPTSNLTLLEAEKLFSTLRLLRDMGVSVVYITHKLSEVLRVADRVTVLRRGRVSAVIEDVGRTSEEELARLMVGTLPPPTSRPPGKVGRKLLSVSKVSVVVDGVERVREVSIEVREGEIVGIAGVAGNGQEELVDAIIGLRRPVRGSIEVQGRRIEKSLDFYRAGGGYIAGDRGKVLAMDYSVAENIAFLYYTASKTLLLRRSKLEDLFRGLVERFRLVARSPWTPVGRLSGGNQQKVIVGSEVLRGFKLLVAVNPTQGLDIATTSFVRNILSELARQGAGILLVSTDLDEILELSDRIYVMSGGRVTGVPERGQATPEKLGVLMGV
ncbi:ABC transporter ATP-binding protein [Aeropyrum camini]|uniref:ABC transporter ATP-binding protein n=1 Tax=Aeropyrum camini SY1 = JCM 12091 TaxID=1198449 RepID=U3TGF8_9CREN|nr:ABC transporter ATP-binding protein [Aeropyrum camini]BAN91093.1 ABC transporter ATP-binding protein [Aeropyrum camini SY1 = JCM 12091]